VIDPAYYALPTTESVDAATHLRAAIVASAAWRKLCGPMLTTDEEISATVVVGMGPDPWDGTRFSQDDLERMRCMAVIGPSEEEWLTVTEGVEQRGTPLVGGVLTWSVRWQVTREEELALGRALLYRYFWAWIEVAAKEVQEHARGCLVALSIDGGQMPLWGSDKQTVAQGLLLHTYFTARWGDNVATE
jgi:hypothetical protein